MKKEQSGLSEDDIAFLVEMTKTVASGWVFDNHGGDPVQCHFCTAFAWTPETFEHSPTCLVVRARQIEGAIEAKLRGTSHGNTANPVSKKEI